MLSFDLHPFEGAKPILFGMPRSRVLEILGPPTRPWVHNPMVNSFTDFWGPQNEINIAYDGEAVCHFGFGPGPFELRLRATLIWSPKSHKDPNPILLQFDPNPLEFLGFLIFTQLGVTTTGFHDAEDEDDTSDQSLVLYRSGNWDKYLPEASKPDLRKYA